MYILLQQMCYFVLAIDGSSSLKSMEMITTGTEMNLVIALGVVSGFAFLVLIVTLSLMFFIRRKSRKSTKDTDKGETINSGVNEIFLRGGKQMAN